MGRTCWSDIIRNTRTMARLIWYHVPPRLSRTVPSDGQDSAESILKREMQQIMAEKKMALDVLEG
jgi:putative membrane protein